MRAQLIDILKKYEGKSDGIILESDVTTYVDKILEKSVIYASYDQSALTSFISFYANNIEEKKGYLTMLLVDKSHRSKRLGSILLNSAISYLSNNGFYTFELKVLESNSYAIRFYEKNGFNKVSRTNGYLLMTLNLQPD